MQGLFTIRVGIPQQLRQTSQSIRSMLEASVDAEST